MVETRTRILGIAPYEGMHAAMDRAAQAELLDALRAEARPIPMTVLSPAAGRPT